MLAIVLLCVRLETMFETYARGFGLNWCINITCTDLLNTKNLLVAKLSQYTRRWDSESRVIGFLVVQNTLEVSGPSYEACYRVPAYLG